MNSPQPRNSGVVRAFAAEYRRVLGDRGAFGLIVLGPLLYGLFYPQPYLGQLIRGVPIAIVDDECDLDLSRTIIQTLNAALRPSRVAARPSTLAEAEAPLRPPGGFRYRQHSRRNRTGGSDRQEGQMARLCRFRLFPALQLVVFQGILEGTGTMRLYLYFPRRASDREPVSGCSWEGVSPSRFSTSPCSIRRRLWELFVPAAFILILEQTLLHGHGDSWRRGLRAGRAALADGAGGGAATVGQGDRLSDCRRSPVLALFLVVFPRLYGFSAMNDVNRPLFSAAPFVLAVSLLGLSVGSWFQRRETASCSSSP